MILLYKVYTLVRYLALWFKCKT